MSIRPVGNMSEWMRDIERRVALLERRLRANATAVSAARSAPATVAGPMLAVGTVLRDNGDGTLTVVEAAPLVEPEEL